MRNSMKWASRRGVTLSLVVVAVVLSVCAGGCSNKSGMGNNIAGVTDIRKDLSDLGHAYADYIEANGKGPPDWQALIGASARHAEAVKRARDAGVTVKWGVRYRDATEGTVRYVLAEAPGGGPKLMLDGSVTK